MEKSILRLNALILISLCVLTTSIHAGDPAIQNATWARAIVDATKQTAAEISGFIRYVKIPSLAMNYVMPTWKIARLWNFFGNTEQAATGFATSYALSIVGARYKQQILELCGDEETATTCTQLVPFAGLFLPTKVSIYAAVGAVAFLQTKEWASKYAARRARR